MSLIYLLVRSALFALHLYVRLRERLADARLARETAREKGVLEAAQKLVSSDPLCNAGLALRLGRASEAREDAAARALAWEERSTRLAGWRQGVVRHSGTSLAYLVIDALPLLALHWDVVRAVAAMILGGGGE